VIIGSFGQNVPYAGFGKEWGFVLSISLIVAIVLGLCAMSNAATGRRPQD